MAKVIILPVVSAERFCLDGSELLHRDGIDLGHQHLLPSSDRRNVVDMLQVKSNREIEQQLQRLEQRL